jgi:hypothetical protein
MKFPHTFGRIAGISLVALWLIAIPLAKAQTIISNETLVSTTFVVNQQTATANCGRTGCRATTSMFAPISVACPAATGKTCTFHISMDTNASASYRCGSKGGCFGGGPTAFFLFLVDGAAPTIGPTEATGEYIFGKNVFTSSDDGGQNSPWNRIVRQSFPASVLSTVTNSSSNNHTIAVSIGCRDTPKALGCEASAFTTTLRVDVFEP